MWSFSSTSSSATSRACPPQAAHDSGRSSCSSASRWRGSGLRPVGLVFVFAVRSATGLSGALGRSSNARCCSPSTTGGGMGGGSATVARALRCLRCATARSSATRSLRRASCSKSCASWPRSAAFSFRSASSSSTEEYRSHLGICVDRLVYFFESRAPVPAAPRGHEVDAGQQRSEG